MAGKVRGGERERVWGSGRKGKRWREGESMGESVKRGVVGKVRGESVRRGWGRGKRGRA